MATLWHMDSVPMISVIIPVYNVEQYLPQCLDSVLGNSYRELEVICVDDGSTDGSGEIIDQYAREDARVRAYHKPNGGVSSARNLGLEKARGEWVCFIDSDDAVNYRFFELLIQAWKDDGERADVVICGRLWHGARELPDWHREIESKENIVQHLRWPDIRNNMMAWAFVWGKMYRRKIVENILFPLELKFSEDTYYNLYVLNSTPSFRLITSGDAEYLYRNRPQSAYSSLPKMLMMKSYEKLLDDSLEFHDRAGRAVSCEISIRHIFAMIISGEDVENVRTCRALMRRALKQWALSGFVSLGNAVAFHKFILYNFIPKLSRVGQVLHNAMARIRH